MDYTLTNEVTWLPNQGWDARIHIAANGDLVNVFMVVTERYVILIDTLLNPTTAHALLDHARPYLAQRQLLVVNSHADWDHAWGNQLFVGPTAQHPAPIIAHTACATYLGGPEAHATLIAMQQEYPSFFADVSLTKPTLTFHYDFIIDGGDLTLHLLPTPGHTPDHISIYIPKIRALLVGDAAELPFPMAHSPQALPTLRASLQTLADLHADYALYCHAPPTSGPQLILENIAYFDALEAACRAAIACGQDTLDLADAALPAALGCEFATVAPTTGAWAARSERARSEAHGVQLRLMLDWLIA